ncbi:MAG: Tol-Pal system beta propeller repeat protein TolB [Alphaproteobacteria bacterium CG_4_10_14_0_8_um_filter_37_21]|nr:MAG: Tol-Pal system beta propeller repeat protein TolB [Alphaproteobacteria bacterium CG_4_10_14_0_8_um_filter_37_21]
MKLLQYVIVIICFAWCSQGHSVPLIEITRGQVKPEPIFIAELYSENASYLAEKISKVIQDNLSGCGAFKIMDAEVFIQQPVTLRTESVRYADWRAIKTRFLFFGEVVSDDGKIAIRFQLHDVIRGKKMLDLTLRGEEMRWRKISHMVSDALYNSITAEEGFFNTQIAYVQPTNAKGRLQNTCIKIMDSDGYEDSVTQITDGTKLVLTPRYSPDGKSLAYLLLGKNKGEVHIMNLQTKVSHLMGSFHGLSFAPKFAPDGKKMLFSISKGGTTAIYKLDLITHKTEKLTEHISIDTSPGFSPDGNKIIFVSDRAGRPQLYTMNADGSDQTRISFKQGVYTQPAWSPRGDLIAFTRMKEGQFYIGVMRPDGEGERLIAKGYMLEDPVWTNNGRYLIFTVQESVKDKQHLVRIDLTGRSMYQIKTKTEAFGASLSPLLGSAIPNKSSF